MYDMYVLIFRFLYDFFFFLWNVVQITIKMRIIVRKPLMIKINKLHLRNLDNYQLYVDPLLQFQYYSQRLGGKYTGSEMDSQF